MTKNRVAILFLILLLIGVAFYNIHFFSKVKAPSKQLSSEPRPAREPIKVVTIKRKPFAEGWERNPFFRPGERPIPKSLAQGSPPPSRVETREKEAPWPSLKLETIFTVDGAKGAVLNGRFVKEGDRTGDVIVAKIESDGVVLEMNGRRKTIKLDQFPNPFRIEGGR